MRGFTTEEQIVILEIALQHLSNTDSFLHVSNYLDLSDEYLESLESRISMELANG